MAAKGTNEKKIVYDKIMEVFEGAFSPDGKVIRVPIDAGEGVVEIKVSLVAAKDVLGGGNTSTETQTSASAFSIESSMPTQAEIDTVTALMSRLGV